MAANSKKAFSIILNDIRLTVETMIGNAESIKCFVDGEHNLYSSCVAKVTEHIESPNPLMYLLNTCIQSFHKRYYNGVKTLLYLICLLYEAVDELLLEGLDSKVIVKGLQQGIKMCLSNLELFKKTFILCKSETLNTNKDTTTENQAVKSDSEIQNGESNFDKQKVEVSIEDDEFNFSFEDTYFKGQHDRTDHDKVLLSKNISSSFERLNIDDISCQFDSGDKIVQSVTKKWSVMTAKLQSLSKSRHFHTTNIQPEMDLSSSTSKQTMNELSCASNNFTNLEVAENKQGEILRTHFPESNLERITIRSLVTRLSRGKEILSSYIIEAIENQVGNNYRDFRLDISTISSMTINGPSEKYSHVVKGLLLKANPQQMLVSSTKKYCNFLLIHGSLTPCYKHLGYKSSFEVTQTTSYFDDNSDQKWYDAVHLCIKKFNITGILVTGLIDDKLITELPETVLIENVSYRSLEAIESATEAVILSYVTDCCQEDIAMKVSIALWNEESWMDNFELNSCYVILSPMNSIFQTVVLCHSVPSFLCVIEENFWHLVYRVKDCINGRVFLQGEDLVEKGSISCLQKFADTAAYKGDVDYSEISRKLSEVFARYSKTLMRNIEICPHEYTIDDYESKKNCWLTAIHFTCQILLVNKELTPSM